MIYIYIHTRERGKEKKSGVLLEFFKFPTIPLTQLYDLTLEINKMTKRNIF